MFSLVLINPPAELDVKVGSVVLQHAGVGRTPEEKSQEGLDGGEHGLPAALPVGGDASLQGTGAVVGHPDTLKVFC